jgi:hypothetical protein
MRWSLGVYYLTRSLLTFTRSLLARGGAMRVLPLDYCLSCYVYYCLCYSAQWRVPCRALTTTASPIPTCTLTGTPKAHPPPDIFSRSLSLTRTRALDLSRTHTLAHT